MADSASGDVVIVAAPLPPATAAPTAASAPEFDLRHWLLGGSSKLATTISADILRTVTDRLDELSDSDILKIMLAILELKKGTLIELAADIDLFTAKCATHTTGSSEWIPVIAQLMTGYGASQRLTQPDANALATSMPAVASVVSSLVAKVLSAPGSGDGADTKSEFSSADFTLCSKALPLESVFLDSSLLPAHAEQSRAHFTVRRPVTFKLRGINLNAATASAAGGGEFHVAASSSRRHGTSSSSAAAMLGISLPHTYSGGEASPLPHHHMPASSGGGGFASKKLFAGGSATTAPAASTPAASSASASAAAAAVSSASTPTAAKVGGGTTGSSAPATVGLASRALANHAFGQKRTSVALTGTAPIAAAEMPLVATAAPVALVGRAKSGDANTGGAGAQRRTLQLLDVSAAAETLNAKKRKFRAADVEKEVEKAEKAKAKQKEKDEKQKEKDEKKAAATKEKEDKKIALQKEKDDKKAAKETERVERAAAKEAAAAAKRAAAGSSAGGDADQPASALPLPTAAAAGESGAAAAAPAYFAAPPPDQQEMARRAHQQMMAYYAQYQQQPQQSQPLPPIPTGPAPVANATTSAGAGGGGLNRPQASTSAVAHSPFTMPPPNTVQLARAAVSPPVPGAAPAPSPLDMLASLSQPIVKLAPAPAVPGPVPFATSGHQTMRMPMKMVPHPQTNPTPHPPPPSAPAQRTA